ncbi:MAG: methyltransferase domain-containing protein [Solirubrobacteraceae bacterium MAG38_C4-C5]|nr:methyltransferase domain-containing protein [Candidatus Siliceabacter maunaloa]
MAVGDELETITFSSHGEEWVEFGPPGARRRVGFHDYAALYSVPGLYERVFYEELGMRSGTEVVGLLGRTLEDLGLRPADQRVLDLGAGSGLGGVELRGLGVGHLVGLDLEPMAREAAGRDHPGVYADFRVGDLGAWSEGEVAELAAHRFTAVVALSALGPGHAPPHVLDRALGLLEPDGLFAFAVTPTLLPGSDDPSGQATGYPDFLDELLRRRARELGRHAYVHRRRTDGADDLGVALVGRLL